MIRKTARTLGMTALAGSMVLGMGACTKVESKASDATSKATDAGKSATDTATSNSAPQPSTDTQTSDTQSSDTQTSDTATDGGGSDSGGLVSGKMGQDVKTSKYTVKVNKVTDNVQSKYDFQKPDAGKRYVDVNITVTNTGSDKKVTVSDFDIKAKLSDNTSPNSDIASGVGTPLNSDGLFKGDSTTGDVVYQVPTGQKIKYLDIDLDSFSLDGGQTIRVNLN